MYEDKNKRIGSATYLKRNSGQYIPFGVWLGGTDCTLI